MRSAAVRTGLGLVVVAALAVFGAPRVPELLAGIEAFRLDGLALEGVRFASAEELRGALDVPAGASVWDDPTPWLAPLLEHPLVRDVEVTRRLPDSLVLRVTEVEPVALVAGPTLAPVDGRGRRLPIDPTRHRLDLPLLAGVEAPEDKETGERDEDHEDHEDHEDGEDGEDGVDGDGERISGLRVLLDELRRLGAADPEFVGLLSELVWEGQGAVVALWGDPQVAIHFRPPLPAARLRQAFSVIRDAAARYPDRSLRAVDLRYAEQVVARF